MIREAQSGSDPHTSSVSLINVAGILQCDKFVSHMRQNREGRGFLLTSAAAYGIGPLPS
jgi:hypothetical protein